MHLKRFLFLLVIRFLRVYRTRMMIESCNGLIQQSFLCRKNFVLSQNVNKNSCQVFFDLSHDNKIKRLNFYTGSSNVYDDKPLYCFCTLTCFSQQTNKYMLCIVQCLLISDFQYSFFVKHTFNR